MLTRRSLLRSLPAVAFLPRVLCAADAPLHNLLIGTRTGGSSNSKGIYIAEWSADGKIGEISLSAELSSPTFMALDRHARHLYAISEVREGRVTAFSVGYGKNHMLKLNRLNEQTAEGNGPAHVSINVDGRSAFVSNYGSGSLTSYKVELSGALSAPVSHFQYMPIDDLPEHAHPHAHEATPSPDGHSLLVNDLGSDRIWSYRINRSTGALTPSDPGFWQGRFKSGPRHLVFHPNGRWVYNANELDSTVDHLVWNNKESTLTTQGTFVSTLPANYPIGTSTASEIITSPDGRFVYVGNRGNETVAKFDVNAVSGKLTLSQLAPHGGKSARHIALDPTGQFLLVACQDSDNIVILSRDPVSGRLSDPLHTYPIGSPQCLIFTT
jgi:6-phosphogluconolactonase (cycloisomerase 2 family)